MWNRRFTTFLQQNGLKPCESEPCVYIKQDLSLILAIYVDYGIILAKNKDEIESVIESLKREFEVHSMDQNTFLGFEYEISDHEINLHQTSYISKILSKFNMEDCKPIDNPSGPPNSNIDTQPKPLSPQTPYRQAIGSLYFAAVSTRPDISFSVGMASRHNSNPNDEDWTSVKRIFKYLIGSTKLGLRYTQRNNKGLVAYCDADFAGDKQTYRSTSGFLILYAGAPIAWSSHRQTHVTLSSTEAEFISLCSTARDIVWIKKLANELGILHAGPVMIHCDNTSTIKTATNERTAFRTRHIGAQAHYPRELVNEGIIDISYVPSNQQLAVYLTKPLTGPKFIQNQDQLMKASNIVYANLAIIYENSITSNNTFSTNTTNTTINTKPAMKIITFKKLLILSLLTSSLRCEIVERVQPIERVNSMLWVPTNTRVEFGLEQIEIEWIHVDPCDAFQNLADQVTNPRVKQMIINLKLKCQESYNSEYLNALDILAKAYETTKIRIKRFEPFTLAVLSLIVVTNVAIIAEQRFDPTSTYNTEKAYKRN